MPIIATGDRLREKLTAYLKQNYPKSFALKPSFTDENNGFCLGLSVLYLYAISNNRLHWFWRQQYKILTDIKPLALDRNNDLDLRLFIESLIQLHRPDLLYIGISQPRAFQLAGLENVAYLPIVDDIHHPQGKLLEPLFIDPKLSPFVHEGLYALSIGPHILAFQCMVEHANTLTYRLFDSNFKARIPDEPSSFNIITMPGETFADYLRHSYKGDALTLLFTAVVSRTLPLSKRAAQQALHQKNFARFFDYFMSLEGVSTLVKAKGMAGDHLLSMTAAHGSEFLEPLIRAGADVDAQNEAGATGAIIAAANGQQEALQLLRKHKANLSLKTTNGQDIYYAAVIGGNQALLAELLLDASAEIAPVHGPLPQIAAATNGDLAMLELLLADSRINPDAIDARKNGITALMAAATEGHIAVVDRLIKAGATIDLSTKLGETALGMAVYAGHFPVVKQLLAVGADPYRADGPQGAFPVYLAAQAGHADILSTCVHVDISKIDQRLTHTSGLTALLIGVLRQHQEVVRILLENKADPNLPCKQGYPPLWEAVYSGNTAIATLLLDAGSNPNTPSVNGFTPYMVAVMMANPALMDLLGERGADPEMAHPNGKRAIDFALEKQAEALAALGQQQPSNSQPINSLPEWERVVKYTYVVRRFANPKPRGQLQTSGGSHTASVGNAGSDRISERSLSNTLMP